MTHRVLRTALAGLVVAFLVLTACDQGPGSSPSPHTHDPKTVTKIFNASSHDAIRTSGGVGLIGYIMPEITSDVVRNGSVSADLDLGSGDIWYSLPRSIQLADRTAVSIEYAYSEGTFSITVTSPNPALVRAAINIMGAYRVKVVITVP